MSKNNSKQVVEEFVNWLKKNGALFPKIDRPAINSDGIMGGIANADIHVCYCNKIMNIMNIIYRKSTIHVVQLTYVT